MPAAALASTLAAHRDLPLGVGSGVHAVLAGLESWEARFDLLERHLLAAASGHRQDPAHAVAPEVGHAWDTIHAARGRVRVADLADLVGWSRRRLLAGFRTEYGISVKEAARIARFDHTRRLVDAGHALAEAAALGGYADQVAHLSREFSALAGRTPGQLRESAYHLA